MPIAKFKDVIPILDVRDVDAALRFYVKRLGFDIDFRDDEHPEIMREWVVATHVCICNGSTKTNSKREPLERGGSEFLLMISMRSLRSTGVRAYWMNARKCGR